MPRQSRDVIYKAARRASCATRNSPGRYLERVVFVEVRQRLRYAVLAVQAEEPMAAREVRRWVSNHISAVIAACNFKGRPNGRKKPASSL